MADLQEINMTKATDMNNKKVRLVGDDGKGYWMEKEDLAKVVGGLIGIETVKISIPSDRVGGSYFSVALPKEPCSFYLVINTSSTPSELFFCNYDGSKIYVNRISNITVISTGLYFYQKNNIMYANRTGVIWNIIPLQKDFSYTVGNIQYPSDATQISIS